MAALRLWGCLGFELSCSVVFWLGLVQASELEGNWAFRGYFRGFCKD